MIDYREDLKKALKHHHVLLFSALLSRDFYNAYGRARTRGKDTLQN